MNAPIHILYWIQLSISICLLLVLLFVLFIRSLRALPRRRLRAALHSLSSLASRLGDETLADLIDRVTLLWAGGLGAEAEEALGPLVKEFFEGAAIPGRHEADEIDAPPVEHGCRDIPSIKPVDSQPVFSQQTGSLLGHLSHLRRHEGRIVNVNLRVGGEHGTEVSFRRVGGGWVTSAEPATLALLSPNVFRAA